MNPRSPIPLRPDYGAHRVSAERAFIHAITASLLAYVNSENALEISAREWPGEKHVGEILTRALKSEVSTLRSGNVVQIGKAKDVA